MDKRKTGNEIKTEWTTRELARAANVSDGYIRNQIQDGKIKARKIGYFWVISDSEARRWLENRQ